LRTQYAHVEARISLLNTIYQAKTAKDLCNPAMEAAEYQASKSEKKKLHIELTKLKQQIETAIPEVVGKWHSLEAESQKLEAAHDKSSQNHRPKLEQLIEINRSTTRYGNCDESLLHMDTREKCEAILENQQRVIAELRTERQQIDHRDLLFRKQYEMTQKELTGRKQDLQKMEIETDGEMSELNDLKTQIEQSKANVETWQQYDGASVERHTQDCLVIKLLHFTLPVTDEHPCLRVRYSGPTFTHAEWIQPVPVDINDCVSYACETQDLPFLFRETRCRLLASDHFKSVPRPPLSKEQLGNLRRDSLGLTPLVNLV